MSGFDIIEKYNQPGPRYTSYPPATWFHDETGNADYQKMISLSNDTDHPNVSLYFHVPFCRQLCHFCGCNTTCLNAKDDVPGYVNAMINEMKNVAQLIDRSRKVTQIHWGGGTPNAIDLQEIGKVMKTAGELFTFSDAAEVAMEVNPAYLQLKDIDTLAGMGFNRLSLGIQDFNTDVLKLVNREPSLLPVESLIDQMRINQMDGVNIDLIYGLPGQTVESFQKTIEKAIDISPDRLVTFSYAHVPWVKKAQKILEKVGLPSPSEKLKMFEIAYHLLTAAGYVAIGMDHYAKPHDHLSKALQVKKLHRNFQGYCTQETTGQVYAFGVSSISQLHTGYFQNTKNINLYKERIRKEGFAVERGYLLTREDIMIREVINQIMCNGHLNFADIARQFGSDAESVKHLLKFDKKKFEPFVKDQLIDIEDDKIQLKGNGFLVVRNIAMLLDPQLSVKKAQYSKTV